MAKAPTLPTITGQFASAGQLNQAFRDIEDAFDNTISRDGSVPNTMSGDLDLNGNSLLNVDTIDVDNLSIAGLTVTDLASVPEWRGAWASARAYVQNDLVKINGNVYICLVPHVSGTFNTDLTALRWELFVERGAAGAGTGDMVGSNNLSDVTNVTTARTNLGLGTVATQNTVPVSMGGTGAPDAATARTNLGLGSLATASSITSTDVSTATLVTESEGLNSSDNDTSWPTTAAVKDYVDTRTSLINVKAAVNFSGVSLAGTYTRTGNTVTVTATAHGMATGNIAVMSITSGGATSGSYTVTVVDPNTFTYTDPSSGTTSGNCTRTLFVRGFGNISGVVRNGTGDYTITFFTAMPSSNYVVHITVGAFSLTNVAHTGVVAGTTTGGPTLKTTTQLRIVVGTTNVGTPTDLSEINVSVII